MKVHKFKIYAELGKPKYYSAFLFETKEDMYALHEESLKISGERKWRFNYEALCRSWLTISPRTQRHNIGHVYFYKGFIGAGIVSHEFTHAACFYFRRVLKKSFIKHSNRRFGSDDEERFCQIVGDMNKQFWNKYFRYVSGDINNR